MTEAYRDLTEARERGVCSVQGRCCTIALPMARSEPSTLNRGIWGVGIGRRAFQIYLGTRSGCITTRRQRALSSFLTPPPRPCCSSQPLLRLSPLPRKAFSFLLPLASPPRPRPKAVLMMATLLDFTSVNNSGRTPMSPLVRGPAATNKSLSVSRAGFSP